MLSFRPPFLKSRLSLRRFCHKLPDSPGGAKPTDAKDVASRVGGTGKDLVVHVPNKFERWLLVHFKRYPSIDKVPDFVSMAQMERVRNQARIRLNLYMIAATLITCYFVAKSGKRAAERGESVQKMNLEWHRKMEEENRKAQENKPKH